MKTKVAPKAVKMSYRFYRDKDGIHYIDLVPCDMNPKSKYYSSINPELVNLIEVNKWLYKIIQWLKGDYVKT